MKIKCLLPFEKKFCSKTVALNDDFDGECPLCKSRHYLLSAIQMSPFAVYLRKLRLSRGKQQKLLAHELGYEPSYLSALERGEKGPPGREFIERLIRKLDLGVEEQSGLEEALQASRRQFSIPRCASDAEFRMMNQIAHQLGRLLPAQIQLIQIALTMAPPGEAAQESGDPGDQRARHIM